MIISFEGEEASTKTTTCYTGPLPIVGFHFDMGWERALKGARADFFKGLKIDPVRFADCTDKPRWPSTNADITIYEMPPPIQLDSSRQAGVREMWEMFVALCAQALSDSDLKLVVVDTMTMARRVKADSFLQTLQEKEPNNPRVRLQQVEWGPANDAMRDIYTTAEGLKKNLAVTHHLTDERVMAEVIDANGRMTRESQLTGRRVLEGLDKTYRYVDVAMRLEKERVEGQPRIKATFQKCGYDLSIEGTQLYNPTWDSIVTRIELGIGGRIEFDKRGASHQAGSL